LAAFSLYGKPVIYFTIEINFIGWLPQNRRKKGVNNYFFKDELSSFTLIGE